VGGEKFAEKKEGIDRKFGSKAANYVRDKKNDLTARGKNEPQNVGNVLKKKRRGGKPGR